MAALTSSSIACRALVHKGGVGVSYSPPVVCRNLKIVAIESSYLGPHTLALTAMGKKGKVGCSMEGKACVEESKWEMEMEMGMGASLTAAAVTMSSPAMALVDERLTTEGTGLPFGLSNNLLGWILVGVFALIWALYFVYTSTLDEDDDSGLSL